MTEERENLGSVSTEERDQFYEESKCVPTTCERALGLPRVRWLQKANDAKPFHKVVDLGCHDGFSTRWLLNSPHLDFLVGIELCDQAIEHANRLKEEKVFPELATYYHGSIFNPGALYDDTGPYDVVVCFELIEHFREEESRQLLRLVHDLLTEDGRAFLTTPHVDGPFGKDNPDPAHIHFFDEKKLAEWIKAETGCFATIVNVQGILHALWRKDSTDGKEEAPEDAEGSCVTD